MKKVIAIVSAFVMISVVAAGVWALSAPINDAIGSIVEDWTLEDQAKAIVQGRSGLSSYSFAGFATWVNQTEGVRPKTGERFTLITVCSQPRKDSLRTNKEEKELGGCVPRAVRLDSSKGERFEAMQAAAEELGEDFAHSLAVARASGK